MATGLSEEQMVSTLNERAKKGQMAIICLFSISQKRDSILLDLCFVQVNLEYCAIIHTKHIYSLTGIIQDLILLRILN